MSLQFVFGASGAGKSMLVYNQMIEDSVKNPGINYILLVPEQYSLALQRKMVMLHPMGGSMNIDVIGFNRLNYRIFDELSVKPGKVLEDFGKTMLIRQLAGSVKDKLSVYGDCLDKTGFIDEVKSLMSELYQYDVEKDRLREAYNNMGDKDTLLKRKLNDLLTIFEAFDEKVKGDYIVAEQLTEVLAANIEKSELIRNSVIVMDGFTGFTPIQLKVITKLMLYARETKLVLTIDKKSYDKEAISAHELFYLTRQTEDSLRKICKREGIQIKEDIFVYSGMPCRWEDTSTDLIHLENNIFRYPYKTYTKEVNNISISVYDNPGKEIVHVAAAIRKLVKEEGFRYKDIAVISGNLEGIADSVTRVFDKYDIPCFIDYTVPLKNNAYMDSIGHVLRIVDENFSYDSVFAFLKSGVLKEIGYEEIELLENYCISRNIRYKSNWMKEFPEDIEESRQYIMRVLCPFADEVKGKNKRASDYVKAIYNLINVLDYENNMDARIYEGLCNTLDKIDNLMSDDMMSVDEFKEILDIGLKDINLGRIPGYLDMVVVGDITRTRLDDVKVLFIIGANDGIIPSKSSGANLISDKEKEELENLDVVLAPTDKLNSYIEQFYLYINMTKPSQKLFVSYTNMNNAGENLRPSYVIGRIKNIFPTIKEKYVKDQPEVSNHRASILLLVEGLRDILDNNFDRIDETLNLYKLYVECGNKELIDRIEDALCFNNIPRSLSNSVTELIKLRTMSVSVSRIEKFASCQYAYFLKYTLGLSERATNIIDSRDIGNILHETMESLYRHVHDNLDNRWDTLSSESRDTLVSGYVDSIFEQRHELDNKNQYVKSVIKRIALRTAEVMSDITDEDTFSPEYFEYGFNKRITLADGHNITIKGIVDRGDLVYSKEEGRLKLRIIDYKSGRHEFDLSKLYEGLSLQLSVYMSIMQEFVRENNPMTKDEAELSAEGMYYYQMKDPYIDAKDEADALAKRRKELKLVGLKNENSEDFNQIVDYSMYKLKDLSEEILSGKIDKNPSKSGSNCACDYCEFSAICRFDDKYGENRYKYPRYPKSDKESIMNAIRTKLGGASDGMD